MNNLLKNKEYYKMHLLLRINWKTINIHWLSKNYKLYEFQIR